MKKRVISQITKSLKITEQYLADYIGVSHNTLQEMKLTNVWHGKDLRIYRLNQIICILRNLGIKNPVELKNILDNERFLFTSLDEDSSYINIINSLVDMTELIQYLIVKIKLYKISTSPLLTDSEKYQAQDDQSVYDTFLLLKTKIKDLKKMKRA